MKRILFFLLVLLTAATIVPADSIINDIEYFSKLFPRIESSANEKSALGYIIRNLDRMNVEYRDIDFTDTEGYHSFSSFIDAGIPGKLKDTLITVIPMDIPETTTDRYSGSYGIAAALQLIEYYSENVPELSLRFLFLGAEKGRGTQYPLGTRNFLETYYPEESAAFIYLNLEKLPTAFKIVSGANGYSTPYWLFDSMKDAFNHAGVPYYHSNMDTILFRLSAVRSDSMIADYLAEGYPAIEISDFQTPASAPSGAENDLFISSEKIIGIYDSIIAAQADGLPSDWDSHYIFNMSEQQYLLVYTILIMLLMIFPILRRKHFGWYMKSLIKNFWSIPALFGFVFGLLAASSLLIQAILTGLNFPTLWQYSPLPFFTFKIAITLLSYSLLLRLIVKLPFSKRGSFYSITALFFLVLSLFVLTWIDISLSFFALWPLCFIFLFTLVRNPGIKLVLLLLSISGLLYGLVEIFLLNSTRIIELITLSPVKGNLLLALILLPFILASIRLDMLLHPSKKITRYAPVFFGIVSAGLLIFILIYSPFDDAAPQPVTVIEIAESGKDSIIRVESPAALPDSFEEKILDGMAASEKGADSIEIITESESFLNRKIVKTVISLPGSPEKINISMRAENSITLFESSYPATWFPAKNILEIYIGKNPPVPLEFSLTLNRNAELDYQISVEYPLVSYKQNFMNKIYSISYRKTLVKYSGIAD